MRWILILGLLALALFSGCVGTNTNTNNSSEQVNITDSNGDVNIKSNDQNTNNWCDIGSSYSVDSPDGSINVEITGIELVGEYAGMCHMRQTYKSENESSIIDYYYDEDGNGYQIMNVNGEETKVSWKNN